MRASTHRAFSIGSEGWEQPWPDASHAVRQRGRGTTTAPSPGHHTTMQNACNTESESTRPRVRTCTPSHLHDACTVRDSTVSQSVGGASRPRRHTTPRRQLPIGRLLLRDEVKLQLSLVHTVFAAESGRPSAVECLNTKTPAQPAA